MIQHYRADLPAELPDYRQALSTSIVMMGSFLGQLEQAGFQTHFKP
jgi:hypothetical protein